MNPNPKQAPLLVVNCSEEVRREGKKRRDERRLDEENWKERVMTRRRGGQIEVNRGEERRRT